MVNPLAGRPDFEFSRERRLTPEDRNSEAEVRSEAEITSQMVQDLVNQYDALSEKAQVLADEIKRTAPPDIPVDENALEVRMALRSLYPGGSEDRITYEQYMASIEYLEKQAAVDPVKIVDSMTGDPVVDSRIIHQEMTSSATGLTAEQAALIASHFGMLALTNRMMQMFQAQNTQKAVAGKMPPATEVGAVIGQILLGLATMLIHGAISRKQAEDVLEETFGDALAEMGTDASSIVDQAQAAEEDNLSRNARLNREGEHQDLVRTYSENYVQNTAEPGYEGWTVANDVHGIAGDLRSARGEAEAYVGVPAQLGKSLFQLMVCRAQDINKILNQIGALMSQKYARDLICCLIRFTGALDLDGLEQLRWLLAIYANGLAIDIGKAAHQAAYDINDLLERNILEPMMHALNNWFQGQVQVITDFLDPATKSNPEDFETILICTPIDEMLQYVIAAIMKLRDFIAKHIRKFWERSQIKVKFGSIKIEILADNKRAKAILRIVDEVIAAIAKGNLCARQDDPAPAPEEVDEVVGRVQRGLPPAVNLPLDGDPYRTFSSSDLEDLRTREGFQIYQSPETMAREQRGLHDCARAKINDKTMAGIVELSRKLAKERRNGSQ